MRGEAAGEAATLILAWSGFQVRPQEGFIAFPGWQGRGRGDAASSWQAWRHPLFIEHLGMLRSEAPHKHEMSLQSI